VGITVRRVSRSDPSAAGFEVWFGFVVFIAFS